MAEGSIRIASRVAGFPLWVLDYLLVHELAHLVHGDHSPAFWESWPAIPGRTACGYLIAKSNDEDDQHEEEGRGPTGLHVLRDDPARSRAGVVPVLVEDATAPWLRACRAGR